MNSVVEHSGDSVRRHRDDYIMGEDVAARHKNVFVMTVDNKRMWVM